MRFRFQRISIAEERESDNLPLLQPIRQLYVPRVSSTKLVKLIFDQSKRVASLKLKELSMLTPQTMNMKTFLSFPIVLLVKRFALKERFRLLLGSLKSSTKREGKKSCSSSSHAKTQLNGATLLLRNMNLTPQLFLSGIKKVRMCASILKLGTRFALQERS